MKENKNKVSGFSKLSKKEKIEWVGQLCHMPEKPLVSLLKDYQHPDPKVQKILDGFSENTLANFPMPYGVAPHFLINEKEYCVPMVIEESSVVAAASSAAKFWKTRNGIKVEVIDVVKIGHVHFYWNGDPSKMKYYFKEKVTELINDCRNITEKMEERGGGIMAAELIDKNHQDKGYYQIEIKFDTCDSMGANFINSVLEKVASKWKYYVKTSVDFYGEEKEIDVIMCILSNYNPDCRVKASVECAVKDLGQFPNGIDAKKFAEKIERAVRIAYIDPYRATTHNKGIFNGVDSVVLATGNDFRAIEACGHTYASRSGQYRGLTECKVLDGNFYMALEIPIAIGTVGGLTNLHPLAQLSLNILGDPDARELMSIIGAVGLMQNFAALRSLVTTGIQKGHMRMHLSNILNQLQATEKEFSAAVEYFGNKIVSFSKVREYLDYLRSPDIS